MWPVLCWCSCSRFISSALIRSASAFLCCGVIAAMDAAMLSGEAEEEAAAATGVQLGLWAFQSSFWQAAEQ